ncbi:voltage-dependent calcium channel subunit alpha-2/delta-3-like isoform X2 [Periplaneta americana]
MKISAIERIADRVQELHKKVYYTGDVHVNSTYYGTKAYDPEGEELHHVNHLKCNPNRHFRGDDINISFSSVHVPTNVFNREPSVIKTINWTIGLDPVFMSNYLEDPSLSWQYFGSVTGIMRQYPGVFWNNSMVDMFDCRMRLWYIDASLSPKDIVILVDNSGSMSGMRHEIARHLVNNILETLGSNDFVNVLKFNDIIEPVIECFKNVSFVQATLGTVRELKLAMKTLKADEMADFRLAFITAFELFNISRMENKAACCNRAIMLITDGIPDIYKDIFEQYNWIPDMRVRLFTYLIGEEDPVAREMQWIACNNNGYYVPLKTLAEVREKVLRYMPVMSRPLVLMGQRNISWTPLYADIADPRITDWMWLQRENKEQSEVSAFCYFPKKNPTRTYETTGKVFKNCTEEPQIKRAQDPTWNTTTYNFVTTVSMPVLDVGPNKTKTAQILGVAGTDVPIEDIKKLMLPYKVGVNGYSFITTNNGHILVHPDLRPSFLGILRPNYNSMDMTEIEHVDEDRGVRISNPKLIELRRAMIDQEYGTKLLNMKYDYDNMRRVSTVWRHYSHVGIKDTPFTVAIALPFRYGMYIANPIDDKLKILSRKSARRDDTRGPKGNYKDLIKQLKEFLQDRTWTIHPDWEYCKYHNDTFREFDSPEDELRHFLDAVDRWTQCSTEYFILSAEQMRRRPYPKMKADSCYCDTMLLSSLVHDALETRPWAKRNFTGKQEKLIKEFGVALAFLATQSGLTRWQTFQDFLETSDFKETHTRTIEEVWYQRAVESQVRDKNTVIYSVPFFYEQDDSSNALVTASYAILSEDRKVPLAVAGFLFQHQKLLNEFHDTTSPKCSGCISCSSDEIECYILDNNGYIVASETSSDTGKFFGEVEGSVMNLLIKEKVFKKISIIDYQAICLREDEAENRAPFLTAPVHHLTQIFEWLIKTTLWLFAQTSLWYDSWTDAARVKPTQLPRDEVKINRTHLEPCIKQLDLYQLQNSSYANIKSISTSECSPHVVMQRISHSNLILVVVDVLCSDNIWTEVRVSYKEVTDVDIFCSKALNPDLTRKRPKPCVGKDVKVEKLQEPSVAECGCNSQFQASIAVLLVCWCVTAITSVKH